MKILRILGIGIGALVALLAIVLFGARFADGPVAIFPGGPFDSGEFVEDPKASLSFVADIEEIQLQSGGTSRTVWVLVEGDEAYIPVSLSFPPGKNWHRKALTSPEAVVRIQGKRYRRLLSKVEDEALHAKLLAAVAAKYTVPPGGDPTAIWFFHLAPPS